MNNTKKAKTLHGKQAIAAIEKKEDRKLSYKERRVVMLEGYVDGVYTDTKGIKTSGVGQTGKWLKKSFEQSFKYHEQLTEKLVPSYNELDELLQAELVQSTYRGDLGLSPNAVALFNKGNYTDAARAFLRNNEYEDEFTPKQIKERMLATAKAMAACAETT
jgi:GH24 family phage-related lysozyme (muramidase)